MKNLAIMIIVVFCVYSVASKYLKSNNDKPVSNKYTVYKALVNGKVVTCNTVEHSKLGYNMSNCYNGNTYFNVTNIEMTVD